jgi:hypothetical protein
MTVMHWLTHWSIHQHASFHDESLLPFWRVGGW